MTQENNFKPGEWVVFEVNRCTGDLKHCKTDFWDRNMVLQIDSISDKDLTFKSDLIMQKYDHFYLSFDTCSNNYKLFRKANPEEIPFPEKWYIKITDNNADVLKQYYDTLPITFQVKFSGYMSNVDVTSDGSFLDYSHLASACLRKNCTEITFEQFKTHVLKETMEPKKEDLTGRYLKYIGSSTKDPEYGDYFRIDSMNKNGLFRLKDKASGCHWTPEDVINKTCKSFELMPEGFNPDDQYINGNWYIVTDKYNKDCVIKYDHTSKSKDIYFSEGFSNNKLYVWNKSTWAFSPCNLKPFDISEYLHLFPTTHELYKPKQPTFEVGKWYKFIWKWDNNSWYYGKFIEFSHESFNWSIWFRTDGSNLQNNPGFDKSELGEHHLLTDLFEIQQYLPAGHVDKISNDVTTLNTNESLNGRYLKATIDKPWCVNSASKGDYFQITDESIAKCKLLKDGSIWSYRLSYDCEIMPKDFSLDIKEHMDDLIEEAKRRYPVGTKFHPSHVSSSAKGNHYCIITSDSVFVKDSEGNIYSKVLSKSDSVYEKWVSNNNSFDSKYGNTAYDRYVYCDGRWAAVVQEESKPEKYIPKVGDWVITKNYSRDYDGRPLKINKINNNGYCYFDKVNFYEHYKTDHNFHIGNVIRKAEPHEIPIKVSDLSLQDPDQSYIKVKDPTDNLTMTNVKNYTPEEALAELKRRGFKKGCIYTYMDSKGRYRKSRIFIAETDPKDKGGYIDCGTGYLWDDGNPSVLHRGPESDSYNNSPFESKSFRFINTNQTDYLKPETLLTQTTLNY